MQDKRQREREKTRNTVTKAWVKGIRKEWPTAAYVEEGPLVTGSEVYRHVFHVFDACGAFLGRHSWVGMDYTEEISDGLCRDLEVEK